jgi:hypothetical protein
MHVRARKIFDALLLRKEMKNIFQDTRLSNMERKESKVEKLKKLRKEHEKDGIVAHKMQML